MTGQDRTIPTGGARSCTVGDVKNVFEGSVHNHDGRLWRLRLAMTVIDVLRALRWRYHGLLKATEAPFLGRSFELWGNCELWGLKYPVKNTAENGSEWPKIGQQFVIESNRIQTCFQ